MLAGAHFSPNLTKFDDFDYFLVWIILCDRQHDWRRSGHTTMYPNVCVGVSFNKYIPNMTLETSILANSHQISPNMELLSN